MVVYKLLGIYLYDATVYDQGKKKIDRNLDLMYLKTGRASLIHGLYVILRIYDV